jgi:hypothetical protein
MRSANRSGTRSCGMCSGRSGRTHSQPFWRATRAASTRFRAPEFSDRLREMVPHRAFRQLQLACDLRTGQAPIGQAEDLNRADARRRALCSHIPGCSRRMAPTRRGGCSSLPEFRNTLCSTWNPPSRTLDRRSGGETTTVRSRPALPSSGYPLLSSLVFRAPISSRLGP